MTQGACMNGEGEAVLREGLDLMDDRMNRKPIIEATWAKQYVVIVEVVYRSRPNTIASRNIRAAYGFL